MPWGKRVCGRGEARPTAACGRDNAALFSTNNNNYTTLSTQCKLLGQGVFTSLHDKNYQNRKGRLSHRRHATSSPPAVLSRATGVLHVSTRIS